MRLRDIRTQSICSQHNKASHLSSSGGQRTGIAEIVRSTPVVALKSLFVRYNATNIHFRKVSVGHLLQESSKSFCNKTVVKAQNAKKKKRQGRSLLDYMTSAFFQLWLR